MLISVIYHNGECRLERNDSLESLIDSCEITQFLRLDGWVTIGCDPIRIVARPPGIEKRQRYIAFPVRNPFVQLNLIA